MGLAVQASILILDFPFCGFMPGGLGTFFMFPYFQEAQRVGGRHVVLVLSSG